MQIAQIMTQLLHNTYHREYFQDFDYDKFLYKRSMHEILQITSEWSTR